MERFYRPVLPAMLVLILAAVIMAKASTAADDPGLFISEICPHNADLIHDSVGFYNDYIIISNTSSDPVSLYGYGLSDDGEQLDKYVFPDISIKSGEDLFLWASPPKEYYNNGAVYTDDEGLYTGFAIRDHEKLYLSDPEGNVIDSAKIPALKENEALLRTFAGDKGRKGSPGILDKEPPVISEMMSSPVISEQSGFYESPFDLTLNSGKYEVYYTLDGSDPYVSGILYENPITISDRSQYPNIYSEIMPVSAVYDDYVPEEPVSKATVVRAVCKNAKTGKYSKESMAVFFIGKDIRDICSHSYTLSLTVDPDGLFSYENGIYVSGSTWDRNKEKVSELEDDPHYAPANYNMHGSGWKKRAHLTLFDEDGKCLYEEDDIVGIHGQTSRSAIQKGFNLFPKDLGQKVFDGFFEGAGETLMLRTGSENDVYDTNIRDALNERISKNLKVFSQDSVCCQLYINGEYWGCYNLQERLDAGFVQEHCNVSADNVNIIKLDPDPVVLSEREYDASQYQKYIGFVRENDLEDDANYDRFCSMVDIDSLIDYYCAEIFFANDDAYYGNLAMWRSRVSGYSEYQDGKWRFLLYDLDNTDAYMPNAAADIDSFTDGSYIGFNPNVDPVFSNVSKNGRFKERFIERFTYLLANDFSYDRIGPIIDEMEEVYTKPMVMSVRRFHDPRFDQSDYHANIEKLRQFFKDRGGYIYDYMIQYMGE